MSKKHERFESFYKGLNHIFTSTSGLRYFQSKLDESFEVHETWPQGFGNDLVFNEKQTGGRNETRRHVEVQVRNVGDLNAPNMVQFSVKTLIEFSSGKFRTDYTSFSIPKDVAPLFIELVSKPEPKA